MGSLDRLLELHFIYAGFPKEKIFTNKIKNDEFKEYQSLKSQIEKAIEFYNKIQNVFPVAEWNNIDNCIKTMDILLQNQKSPQDIEKIQNYDEIEKQYQIYFDLYHNLKQDSKKNQEIVDRLKEYNVELIKTFEKTKVPLVLATLVMVQDRVNTILGREK